jgi:hypothetical protein
MLAIQNRGRIMAKRKKQSKLPKRAKLRRGNSAKRGKPRKGAKSATAKRTIARAKPKPNRATAKKAAPTEVRKMKKPAVETVVVDVIEQPASGVITVTEVEETRQVN